MISKVPNHQLVYDRLRDMVLFGALAPGQPVTIQGLTATLDAGVTPVREAIRRLIAEGALSFQGNRRVSVPLLTSRQLEDLSFARQAIEPRLAYMAAHLITEADIDRLQKIDIAVDAAIAEGDIHKYLLNNYRFHFRLYELAKSDILMSIASSLWLQVGPSLRVVCGRYGTSNLPDRHEEAVAAMREGNPDALARAISEDIQQGFDQIDRAIQID